MESVYDDGDSGEELCPDFFVVAGAVAAEALYESHEFVCIYGESSGGVQMLLEKAFDCDVAEDDLAIYGLFDGFVGVVLGGFVLLEFLFVGLEVVPVYLAERFDGEFKAAAFVCAWFSDYGHVEYGFFSPAFLDFDGEGVSEGDAGGEDEGRTDVVCREVQAGFGAFYDVSYGVGENFVGKGYAFVFLCRGGADAVDVADVEE